jgi:predicted DNA-binding transcriptional regulator AlpA
MPRTVAPTSKQVRQMLKHSQPTASWFDKLSDSALIKLDRIVKNPGNTAPLVDTSRSTWWRWVADGTAPAPVRPTGGTTLWRVGDLRRFLENPEGHPQRALGKGALGAKK